MDVALLRNFSGDPHAQWSHHDQELRAEGGRLSWCPEAPEVPEAPEADAVKLATQRGLQIMVIIIMVNNG